MKRARHRPAPPPCPQGSVSVPFAVMLPVLVGCMGLAIDLSMLYARNVELQNVADGAAVAAARELNGTAAGVAKARTKATQVVESNYFKLSTELFSSGSTWGSAALYLSSAPTNAPWVPADGVNDDASAAMLLYAKADTAALNAMSGAPGVVSTSFMRALDRRDDFTAAPVAVAGRSGMQVTPLGICARSTVKFASRASAAGNELVELGYRRGVSYDLLQLNPAGPAAQNFLVNPVAAGTAPSLAAQFAASAVKPYFCSGSMAYANLRPGATVHVQPLAGLDLHAWLNSRFGDYAGAAGCASRDGAPPDTNIREYKSPYSWMTTTLPAALPTTTTAAPNSLLTAADLMPGEASAAAPITAAKFGPLWIYNKAVKYVAGAPTGTAGVVFSTADWGTLYAVSPPPLVQTASYVTTPYVKQFTAPSSGAAFAERRMLNIPLLNCSSAVGATATVLGIGRFFMTSRATPTAIYAEFAGLASDEKLAVFVALHQ